LLGILLSGLLVAETVNTYRYVERGLVREEAEREADRQVRSVLRAARQQDAPSTSLPSLLEDVAKEYPHKIAWIRVLTHGGHPVAATSRAGEAPTYTATELRVVVDQRRIREWPTSSGSVLLLLNPVRLRPTDHPVGAESSGPPEFIEMAVYLNGISVNFGPLRQDLVVGLTAAVALFVTVIAIRLRFGQYLRSRQIENELALARQVQFALFPAADTLVGNTEFAARCVPAWQVAGDLYDVFTTENGETVLVLADVSGKGVPAALLMGLVEGAVRASCVGDGSTCSRIAEHLNGLLYAKTARERFVTMFWCSFNPQTGTLRYVNAGHCPPLLIRASGEVLRLDRGGPVLGVLPRASFQYGEVLVEPEDLLVTFSDGIVEATRADDEEFGEDRLLSAIEEHRFKAPAEICNKVFTMVGSFLKGRAAHDDQTLVIARLQPSQTERLRPADAEMVVALD
jgi:serine phosphatase RsbU (regulator of sigma subunit)